MDGDELAYEQGDGSAGLALGVGLIAPAVAYLATMPFEGVHGRVAAAAIPFALGAATAAACSAVAGRAAAARRAVPAAAGVTPSDAAEAAGRTGILSGRLRSEKDAGFPVISRAQGALDEEAAWAEIDASFNDDSLISCDPSRSKDIYQIALEELGHTNAGAWQAEGFSVPNPVSSATTAQFVAMAGQDAATTSDLRAHSASDSMVTAPLTEDDADTDAARLRALQSLADPAHPAAPASKLSSEQSVQEGSPRNSDVAGAVGTASDPDRRTASGDGIPLTDFSGHEDMWAEALAILAEGDTAGVDQASEQGSASAEMVHGQVESPVERSANHEFLRVIQGGTASFPALQAEA